MNRLLLLLSVLSTMSGTALASGRTDLLVTTDCGAIPSDGIDDFAEIQKCIDMASNSGGGVVYLPSGVYTISATLKISASNVRMEGEGGSTIIAHLDGDGTLIEINGPNGPPAERNGVYNLVLTRTADPKKASVALKLAHAYFTVVDNVFIRRSDIGIDVGIENGKDPVEDNFRTRISNSYILGREGGVNLAGIIFRSAADCIVENTFIEVGSLGVGVKMTDGSNGITVEHLLSLGGMYGVYLGGGGYARLIRSSIIESASDAQIFIGEGTHEVSVISSWIGNGTGDDGGTIMRGLLVQPDAAHVIVLGNRFGNLPGHAIDSLGSDISIDSNEFLDNGYNAKYGPHDSVLIEAGRNIRIRGNHFQASNDRCALNVIGTTTRVIVSDNINDASGLSWCNSGSGTPRIYRDNIP